MQQFGGLARPGRDRPQARQHEAGDSIAGMRPCGGTGLQDAAQNVRIRGCTGLGFDPKGEPGASDTQGGNDGLQAGFEPREAELRQGRLALKDDHVRRNRGDGPLL
jgi:hypothetical protein